MSAVELVEQSREVARYQVQVHGAYSAAMRAATRATLSCAAIAFSRVR
jgi:hypothetical protein